MASYSITFSELEELGMQYVCADTNDWVNNACKERARLAVEEAFNDAVNAFISRGEAMPGSKEEIIKLAYQKGYIIPYKDHYIGNTTPTQI